MTDHRALFITVPVQIPPPNPVRREVWDYRNARWSDLYANVQRHDWSFVSHLDIDEAVDGDVGLEAARSVGRVPAVGRPEATRAAGQLHQRVDFHRAARGDEDEEDREEQ